MSRSVQRNVSEQRLHHGPLQRLAKRTNIPHFMQFRTCETKQMKLDPLSGHCMHCGEILPVLVLSVDSYRRYRDQSLASWSCECMHCGESHCLISCKSKYTGRTRVCGRGWSQRCPNKSTNPLRPCGICNEWFTAEDLHSHVDKCISRAWREPNSFRCSMSPEPLRLATGLNHPLDGANQKPKRAPPILSACPRFEGWDLDEWLPDFPM